MAPRPKAEDCIGETFNNGNLEIVELIEKSKHSKYKVICKICSQDPELFPLGYFIAQISDLRNGKLPCGCSKKHHWDEQEFLIKAKRAAKQKDFIVHGYTEEFRGQNTKVKCECLKDEYIWESSLTNVIHNSTGCKVCKNIKLSDLKRMPYEEVLNHCEKICKEKGYTFLGFTNGYINQKSKLEYECPHHGIKTVSFTDFKDKGHGCIECAQSKNIKGLLRGYFPKRAKEKDYLYVLNFDNKYLKIGRTFKLKTRLNQLKSKSKITPTILFLWTACHDDIFSIEQQILDVIDQKNLGYFQNLWKSTELFQIDSLDYITGLVNKHNINKMEV